MNIVPLILSSLIGALLALGSFFTYQHPALLPDGYTSLEEYLSERGKAEILGATATKPAGLFTYRLSGSGISSSATSFTLTSLTLPQNDYPIQDSDLSDTFYLTFEPGSTDRQEFVSCTTVGANTGSSVAISGCTRGISPVTPFTASTTLQFAHSGGSAVIFSDSPSLLNEYAAKANSESITAGWVFASTSGNLPGYISLPSNLSASSTAFASVSFAQNLASQGAATSTESVGGIVELATALETASSTNLGADRPLVLQALNATDTPQRGCASGYAGTAGAGCSVIATLTGKIRQAWIDLTEAFTFSGGILSTASSTYTATTSISASNVNSRALILNGLAYSFNSARQASSTILAEDGSGSLSFVNTYAQKFYLNTATGAISGSSATTTIFAVSVPANTLGTANAISCRLHIPIGSATNLALLKLQASYGGIASSTILTSNIGGGSGNVLIENATILLSATGAASTQKLSLSAQTYNDATFIGSIGTKESTPNIDSTAAQPLILMAQFLVQTGSIPAGQVVCTLIR